YESLVDKKFTDNKLYAALKEIFELQKDTNCFLLFLTTEISNIHKQVESSFKEKISLNISEHPEIQTVLEEIEETSVYNDMSDLKKKALGFAKSVIIDISKEKHWDCEHQGICIYEYNQPSGTRMLNLVVKLSKSKSAITENSYIQDIIKIIREMPEFFTHNAAKSDTKVKKHLDKVKTYREKIRNEFFNNFDN
ncbi:MAG: hypothetical protein WBB67_06410, partial [bacterium]